MTSSPAQLDQLLGDLRDGTLDAVGWAQLDELIIQDDEARDQYLAYMNLVSDLRDRFAGTPSTVTSGVSLPSDTQLTDSAHPIASGNETHSVALANDDDSWWQARWETVRYIASNYTVLSLVVSGLFFAILFLSMAQIVPNWKRFVPGNDPKTPSVEFVAHIIDASGATFDESSDGDFKNHDLFEDDSIVLKAGLVVIEYDTGARVVLEGPATYQIQGSNGGNLQLGKLVAQVDTEQAKGFAVEIPGARIVDLGTEFGIEIQGDGSVDVAVITGEVDVVRAAHGGRLEKQIRLTAGQGATVEANSGEMVRRSNVSVQLFATMWSRLEATREDLPVDDVSPFAEASLIAGVDFESSPSATGREHFDRAPDDLDAEDGITVSADWTLGDNGDLDYDNGAQTALKLPSTIAARFQTQASWSISIPDGVTLNLSGITFDLRAGTSATSRGGSFNTSLDGGPGGVMLLDLAPLPGRSTGRWAHAKVDLRDARYQGLTNTTVTLYWYSRNHGVDIDTIRVWGTTQFSEASRPKDTTNMELDTNVDGNSLQSE